MKSGARAQKGNTMNTRETIREIKKIIESTELSAEGMVAEIGETLNAYEHTNRNAAPLYALTDISTLSVKEVADQLMNSRLERDEKIGDVRLEYGCDLDIDILVDDPSDPRLDGHLDRTETFTLSDIREDFTEGTWYTWAKDEDGEDVLVCF